MVKNKLLWSVGIGVGLVCAFFITDCSAGKSVSYLCYVMDKQYKPAWTEYSSHYDSSLNTTIVDTFRHPEEWHVYCQALDSSLQFDCNTTVMKFASITNNQELVVKVREGRWLKINYLPRIQ